MFNNTSRVFDGLLFSLILSVFAVGCGSSHGGSSGGTGGGGGGSTLTFSSASVQARPNTAVNTALTGASGGTTPYTWSVVSGNLPAGLVLSAGGVLSGQTASTGSFPVTVLVQDAAAHSAQGMLTIVIDAPIAVSPSSLPNGVVGTAYSQQISATGGNPPLTFSQSGTLPPGLTFNPSTQLVSGTPTTSGTFNFSIQVQDTGSLNQVNQPYTITVN